MKVMLADDEQGMQILVEHIVTEAGHDFCYAADGKEALEVFEAERPDLLILDIMMPGLNGFDVCSRLRERGFQAPIIFLSAKGDIVDKSIGFGAGADDYLVKPFIPQELTLRIEALLRRGAAPDRPKDPPSRIMEHDGLVVDLRRHRVLRDGAQVELTPKEFQILALLAESPGEVFSREDILENVWGPGYMGDPSDITVFIRRIRKKIEVDPSNPRYLQTVWHVGYRFGD